EVRGSDLVNMSDDPEDVRTSTHLLTQVARAHAHSETVELASHGLLLDRAHDSPTQILVRKRLGHVVVGAAAYGVNRGVQVAADGRPRPAHEFDDDLRRDWYTR